MSKALVLAVCLSAAPTLAAAASDRTEAAALRSDRVFSPSGYRIELDLNAAGTGALARLSRCREFVYDFPQQCDEEVLYSLPALQVDRSSRTLLLDGRVVARWSRLGRWLRVEPGYRLRHEIAAVDGDDVVRVLFRAKVFLERAGA